MKKKYWLLLFLFSTTGLLTAQTQQSATSLLSPKIQQLQIAKQAPTTIQRSESLQKLANDIERIALANPKDWHAQYYTAYAYTELANNAPKKDIDKLCDRAEEFLIKAMGIRPREAENHVLKAYLLSARINVNPMFRGASMGRESKAELDKALELKPENPRAYYVRAMGIYYTPAAFGGGKKKAKPYLEICLKNYRKYAALSPLDPSWGQPEAEKLLATY